MMKSPWRKLATLATSALLLTSGLVGVSSPASAAEPSTLFDFESNEVGAGGWSNQFSFSEYNNGWANTVDDQPSGGSTSGSKAIKATSGGGAYSGTSLGSIAVTDSLIGTDLTATMAFHSPEAGKQIYLKVEQYSANFDGATVTAEATATTVIGWQILTFDFANPVASTAAYDPLKNYNIASVDYDPSSTEASAADKPFYIDNVAFNGAVTPPLAPATLFNYENETLVADPYPNILSYSTDGNGWGNYVTSPSGGSATGTIASKGVNGSGAVSVVSIGSIDGAQSLLSSNNLTVTMNFNAPQAGKIVSLSVVDEYYGNEVARDASAVTIEGWQTLTFDFATATAGTFDPAIAYSRARVDYDTASQSVSSDFFFDDVAFNGATPAPLASNVSLTDYDVRLVASQKDTAVDADEWTECGGQSWCANKRFFLKMMPAGSTTTITYVVTNHSTQAAVVGATVNLRVNTGYSGSNATWSSGDSLFGEVAGDNGNDAGLLVGTTDANGEVSFVLTNTNNSGEPARTLNDANPYPAPGPLGETKAAIEATVVGATAQYIDVLWPHISSSVLNIKPISTVDPNNKGRYPHIRLDKSFSLNSYDASWWDGVYQYRDADTKAYLKYIPARSTFALSYLVTDAYNLPLANAPVTLIVNANNSCAKTFFIHQGNLIGPDDCSGGGQTELPAQMTDFQGRVTFILTNTNIKGEAMPTNLSGPPTVGQANEVGTNIKPHLVGATQEGIDMLFAHFVEVTGKPTFTAASEKTLNTANGYSLDFILRDPLGKPIPNAEVSILDNDLRSAVRFTKTDSKGRVILSGKRELHRSGTQVIGVSYAVDGELPVTATTKITWVSTAKRATVSGGKRAFTVRIANAKGVRVKIAVAGGGVVYRTPKSNAASFKINSLAGAKSVSVTIAGKTSKHSVRVTK